MVNIIINNYNLPLNNLRKKIVILNKTKNGIKVFLKIIDHSKSVQIFILKENHVFIHNNSELLHL